MSVAKDLSRILNIIFMCYTFGIKLLLTAERFDSFNLIDRQIRSIK